MLTWEIQHGESPYTLDSADAIDEIWSHSTYPSPFASRPLLALLARSATADGATPVAALGTDTEGRAAALWPLVEQPSGRIEFLQGRLCDHGTALARPDVAPRELARGLAAVLQSTSASRLFLANLPAWDITREASREALAQCGWNAGSIEANADPVLAEEPGPDVAERLAARVQGTSLRNYANRLAKRPGYAFEVFDDETEIAEWSAQFCDCHDWRWAATDTPSELASPTQRRDFEETLRAWSAAGSLLRFSIRIANERIASAVVLRAGNRLIYHRIAHSPAHDRTRAATVLVRNLVLWMAENAESTLDFGLGDEGYKYRFATREERLWRVYGAKNVLSPSRITRQVEATIRASESLQKTWDRLGNRWLRGHVLSRIHHARSEFRKSVARRTGGRAPDTWPGDEPTASPDSSGTPLYVAPGIESDSAGACRPLATSELLERIETHWPLAVEDRPLFYERRHAGWVPYALTENGASEAIAWLWNDPEDPGRWWVKSNGSRPRKGSRGGDGSSLLQALRSRAGAGSQVFAEAGGPGGFETSELTTSGFEPTEAIPPSRD